MRAFHLVGFHTVLLIGPSGDNAPGCLRDRRVHHPKGKKAALPGPCNDRQPTEMSGESIPHPHASRNPRCVAPRPATIGCQIEDENRVNPAIKLNPTDK